MSVEKPFTPGESERLPDVFAAPRVPGTLPDRPGETNLLPISALAANLRVEFDQWTGAPTNPNDFPAVVQPYWDEVPLTPKRFQYPFDAQALFFLVPEYLLAVEGAHKLKYRITADPPIYDDLSKITEVLIDWSPPSRNATPSAVLVPAEVIADGISEDYLAQNGDQLLLKIPHYSGTRTEDRVMLFWRHSPPRPGDEVALITHTVTAEEAEEAQNDPTSTLSLALAGQSIRDRGEGTIVVDYQLADRAGNSSTLSAAISIDVDFGPRPVLAPPTVPAFADGLITRAESLRGVEVLIGQYGAAQRDRFVVRWGTQASFEEPVGNSVFPLYHSVPWEVLTVLGTSTPQTVPVSYSIRRGARSWTSGEVLVAIDLSVAGPANPDPSNLNPRLQQVLVKGNGGDNVVRPEPVPDPPTLPVELVLYDNPRPGERLDLFWGTLSAPVASVTLDASHSPGSTVTFQVRWADVIRAGNSAVMPVRYTTFNGVNGQQSPDTLVDVKVVVVEDLPLPQFPDRDRLLYINCSAQPWNGIRIVIPPDARFEGGDELILHWDGYSGTALSGQLILQENFPMTLTASAATEGIQFTIEDFERHILPLGFKSPGLPSSQQDGSGEAWYTLYKKDGSEGTSKRREAYCSIGLVPAGAPCPCRREDYLEDSAWCLPTP